MPLSARLPLLLALCLLGATRVAISAPPSAEAPEPGASSAPAPASASEPSGDKKPLSAQALTACEAAVSDSLRTLRGPDVQRIEFSPGAPVIVSPHDEEVPLKGTGRYANGSAKAAVSFSYGCNYNVRTGKTNGVVIGDAKAAVARRQSEGQAWQPDLSHLSPQACEAAVASLLKNRHPRVGRIAFDAESRQLKPATKPERTLLQGQGGVQRAPGMQAEAFTYRCEFDNRSGALADVQASE